MLKTAVDRNQTWLMHWIRLVTMGTTRTHKWSTWSRRSSLFFRSLTQSWHHKISIDRWKSKRQGPRWWVSRMWTASLPTSSSTSPSTRPCSQMTVWRRHSKPIILATSACRKSRATSRYRRASRRSSRTRMELISATGKCPKSWRKTSPW